jgi:hypothetical protein
MPLLCHKGTTCAPTGTQGQYWSKEEPYKLCPVTVFFEDFERSATGKAVDAHVSALR